MSKLLFGFPGHWPLAVILVLLHAGHVLGQASNCDTTNGGFTLSIEQVAQDLGTYVVGTETVDLTGYSTYRLYLECETASDKLSSVYGSSERPLHISSSTSFYQSALFGGANGALANGISPLLFGAYPDVEYDSWVTIGIDQMPNATNGETNVSLVEDAPFNPLSLGFANGGNLIIDSETGSSWFIDNSDAYSNGLAGDDGKVLVAQLTTDGEITGQLGMQVFRNGISDEASCIRPYLGFQTHGCLEPSACNYTPDALFDNGSCDFCSCPDSLEIVSATFASDSLPQYAVEVDLIADHDTSGIPALAGTKTYRLYAKVDDPNTIVNAVFGNDEAPLAITTTTTFHQSPLGGATPSNISPLLFDFAGFEDLPYDSWGTIGIDRSPSFMDGPGYEPINTAGDWVAPFEAGGGIFASGVVGGTWFAFPSSANVVPDEDLRILIGQFTTSGVLSGTLGLQVVPANPPNGVVDYRLPFSFSAAELGTYEILLPEICTCENVDGDYLCDAEDDCVGAYDECGVCNGSGPVSECGCSDIPEGDCDCDGNQLDAVGVCGGSCTADLDGNGTCDDSEILGCLDAEASNYDASATQDDGSCFYLGCTDSSASNYDATADTDDGSCLYPGCTDSDAWNFDETANVDDGSCQANACGVDGSLILATNYAFTPASLEVPTGSTVVWQNEVGTLHNVNGVTNSITDLPFNNPEDFSLPAITGNEAGVCMGSFTFTIPGVYLYDCSVGIHADLGMVASITVGTGGCMDSAASNYAPAAEFDDGSCLFPGCTEASACNYDATANDEDGSCTYVDGICQTCENGLITDNDTDGDGVCDADEVAGCQDVTACNYNAAATDSDDSCTYVDGICETCENGLIVDNDSDDDGVCDADEVAGCQDATACNYNAAATDSDDSCTYVDGICETCENGLIIDNDTDGDGVCDLDEIAGCQDATACNYNADATDSDDSCTYVDGICQTCENGLIVDNDTDGDGVCDLDEIAGCQDVTACNYNAAATDSDDSCTYVDGICQTCENGVIVDNDTDGDGVCDADEVAGCQDQTACNYNAAATDSDDSCTYVDGICETCENGIIVGNDIDGDGVCDADEVAGCQDATACNYNATATDSNDSCTYVDGICQTCENGLIVDNDTDGDGVCDLDEIAGCQDATSCNYNADATDSDDSCTYVDGICQTCENGLIVDNDTDGDGVCDLDEIAGCQDATACNFNADATDSDDSCTYVDGICQTCENGLVVNNDTDGDGVCNADEIAGCQDATACNYDADATDSDDSCTYVDGICQTCENGLIVDNDTDGDGVCDLNEIAGCQDATACNYNAAATDSDDSCTYVDGICETCENGIIVDNDTDGDGFCDADEIAGCQDATACNFNADATDSDDSCTYVDGICQTCENGLIVDNDTDGDGVCNADEIAGCQDATACNYDADATDSDDSCTYVDGICETCENGLIVDNDTDGDGVCNAEEIAGCQDATACNYNAAATDSDDSCTYVDGICQTCENGVIVDNDTDGDGVCNADEIAGCQDQTACNYNAAATDSDDSCTYVDGICQTCENGLIVDNDSDDDGVCNADEVAGCQDATACNYNAAATDSDDSCTYVDGICQTCENGLIVDNDTDGDGVCDLDEIAGCQDTTACNYNAAATDSDDSCAYVDGVCETCENGIIVDNDTDGDGVCDADEIAGCQDTTACNYNAAATDSDDSCTYVDGICQTCENGIIVDNDTDGDGVCNAEEIAGCQDATACNFNAAATDSDDSCTYAAEGLDCDGNCLNDADNDGICDEDETPCHDYNLNGICDSEEVYGCTYPEACNYDDQATADNGSCTYAVEGFNCDGSSLDGSNDFAGCTYPSALNFSAAANVDDGSCTFPDLVEETGPCLFDVSGDGTVNTPDLLIFLQYWEASCE